MEHKHWAGVRALVAVVSLVEEILHCDRMEPLPRVSLVHTIRKLKVP